MIMPKCTVPMLCFVSVFSPFPFWLLAVESTSLVVDRMLKGRRARRWWWRSEGTSGRARGTPQTSHRRKKTNPRKKATTKTWRRKSRGNHNRRRGLPAWRWRRKTRMCRNLSRRLEVARWAPKRVRALFASGMFKNVNWKTGPWNIWIDTIVCSLNFECISTLCNWYFRDCGIRRGIRRRQPAHPTSRPRSSTHHTERAAVLRSRTNSLAFPPNYPAIWTPKKEVCPWNKKQCNDVSFRTLFCFLSNFSKLMQAVEFFVHLWPGRPKKEVKLSRGVPSDVLPVTRYKWPEAPTNQVQFVKADYVVSCFHRKNRRLHAMQFARTLHSEVWKLSSKKSDLCRQLSYFTPALRWIAQDNPFVWRIYNKRRDEGNSWVAKTAASYDTFLGRARL